MKLLSPSPFWPIRDGLPATFPALDDDARCDVAIIGAGITGALIAWHLADAGIDVVVVDRREAAHGSTAGNTGLLLYELDVPLIRLAKLHGRENAVRVYQRCRATIAAMERLVRKQKLECEFVCKASLYVAASRQHVPRLRREYEARATAGLPVTWWSHADLAAQSSLPHAAAILNRDAAQLDAYRLTYALLGAARRAGARVFDRTSVSRWRFHRQGVELRLHRGGVVRARQLVVATGYESEKFLPRPVGRLASTFAIVSEPMANFDGWPADRALIWDTADPYLYLRTTADGRAIIGGYDEAFRDPAHRDRMLGTKAAWLLRRFGQLFPRLSFEIATAWAGTFGTTSDGLPFIGHHAGVPHTWFALGFGGNGITFSLIAAEIIRAAMLGRPDPDAALFGFDRQRAD
jgi:glycine/D-amino acid oxidase-like deaminating enzyme